MHTIVLICSHLCFERVGRAIRDPERIIISLKLVKDVVKAKPFAVLPGSGMSIEVTLERGDKVRTVLSCTHTQTIKEAFLSDITIMFVSSQFTFSAMLNRDQAYRSILDQGMILGLPWGSDPIGNSAAAMDGDDDDEDNERGNPSSNEGAEDGSHDQQEAGQ